MQFCRGKEVHLQVTAQKLSFFFLSTIWTLVQHFVTAVRKMTQISRDYTTCIYLCVCSGVLLQDSVPSFARQHIPSCCRLTFYLTSALRNLKVTKKRRQTTKQSVCLWCFEYIALYWKMPIWISSRQNEIILCLEVVCPGSYIWYTLSK